MDEPTANVRRSFRRDEYTFPTEARILEVLFRDEKMIIYLEDGRFFGVPLEWIPWTPAKYGALSLQLPSG